MTLQTFIYPKTRHIRLETPKQFKSYSSYRPFLKREFSGQCVYCRSPDWLDPSAIFTIDHYLPKDYHRDLECEYSNLYYCCHACNSRKGTHPYIKDRRTKKIRKVLRWTIPNPCDHIMTEYMRVQGRNYTIAASSLDGQKTIDLLDLNSAHRIMHRRRHEQDIKSLRHRLESLNDKKAILIDKMSTLAKCTPSFQHCATLIKELSEKKVELEKCLAYLASGEVAAQ